MIEKESLRIVFALMKFCRFIHERRFTLQMNQRPLLTIFGSLKNGQKEAYWPIQLIGCSDGEPSYWITILGWNSCHQVNCITWTDCPDLSQNIVNLFIASLWVEIEIKKNNKKNTMQYCGRTTCDFGRNEK